MRHTWKILLLIGMLAAGCSPSNDEVISGLRQKKPACQINVAKLEQVGVRITDYNATTVAEYDEALWEGFEHDDKVRQALLIFCAKMPNDGHYTVLIRGLHNGRTLASVIDGNYWDN